MNRHVAMSLFKTIVLLDVVKVITTDDNGPHHLHLLDNSSKNATTDGDITSEGAFLVNVGSFNCLTRGFESKTDTAVVSQAFLGLVTFTVQENSWLLLESFLVLLIGHASKHS